MMRFLPCALLLCLVAVARGAGLDWPDFLARHDMRWERMPENYFEGLFVGNGLLGTIIYRDAAEKNALRFEIGRTDVYDHRPGSAMHYGCRLPIGQLLLRPVGKITGFHGEVDLWNAEARGDVTTGAGVIHWRCFAGGDNDPGRDGVIVIEVSATPGEAGAAFALRPEQAASPRYLAQPMRDKGFVYDPNPPSAVSQRDGMEVCVQPLKAGNDYATAWRQADAGGGRRVICLTVANRLTRTGSADDAVAVVKRAIARGLPEIEREHRAWWHAFYPASFVTVPDGRLEAFYWIQLYKMASATRGGCPPVDLMGPWFKLSVWAAYWQNLNTQLAYYTVLPANHPELGANLCDMLDAHAVDLINNVPAEYRADSAALGNPTSVYDLVAPAPGPVREKLGDGGYHFIALPWFTQQYYLQTRFTADDARLRDRLYPLMRRTFNTYLHVLDTGTDGRLHIPRAFSDEYGYAPDTSMNIALLRWGLETLLDTSRRLGIDDPLVPRWREVLEKLVDYPVDENGIMIGAGASFARTHRHYSHLFAIFPLYVMNIERQPELRPLMEKSIARHLALEGDNCMFKYTGDASLYAALGRGDDALRLVRRALEPQPRGPTVTPNTLYSENGWQTFESPISAARAMLDMLIQSWGGTIRVFPACPAGWRNAAFRDLRAEGAFLVSASRKDGRTQFVRIHSLAGSPCRVRCDLAAPVHAVCAGSGGKAGFTRPVEVRGENGVFDLTLPRDGTAMLYSGDAPPADDIRPVSAPAPAWGCPGPG